MSKKVLGSSASAGREAVSRCKEVLVARLKVFGAEHTVVGATRSDNWVLHSLDGGGVGV